MHSEILSTAVVSVEGEAGSFQSINNVVCHQMQTLSNSMGQVQSSLMGDWPNGVLYQQRWEKQRLESL